MMQLPCRRESYVVCKFQESIMGRIITGLSRNLADHEIQPGSRAHECLNGSEAKAESLQVVRTGSHYDSFEWASDQEIL